MATPGAEASPVPGRWRLIAILPSGELIKDVSARGAIVLDLFGGSGSTLFAAHKTGRGAVRCELDPAYCDRIIRRWESYAKDEAEQVACGITSTLDAPARAT